MLCCKYTWHTCAKCLQVRSLGVEVLGVEYAYMESKSATLFSQEKTPLRSAQWLWLLASFSLVSVWCEQIAAPCGLNLFPWLVVRLNIFQYISSPFVRRPLRNEYSYPMHIYPLACPSHWFVGFLYLLGICIFDWVYVAQGSSVSLWLYLLSVSFEEHSYLPIYTNVLKYQLDFYKLSQMLTVVGIKYKKLCEFSFFKVDL